MRNFRKHHVSKNRGTRSENVKTIPVERFGSAIDKAAMLEYYWQKYSGAGTDQTVEGRERFDQWYTYFNNK